LRVPTSAAVSRCGIFTKNAGCPRFRAAPCAALTWEAKCPSQEMAPEREGRPAGRPSAYIAITFTLVDLFGPDALALRRRRCLLPHAVAALAATRLRHLGVLALAMAFGLRSVHVLAVHPAHALRLGALPRAVHPGVHSLHIGVHPLIAGRPARLVAHATGVIGGLRLAGGRSIGRRRCLRGVRRRSRLRRIPLRRAAHGGSHLVMQAAPGIAERSRAAVPAAAVAPAYPTKACADIEAAPKTTASTIAGIFILSPPALAAPEL